MSELRNFVRKLEQRFVVQPEGGPESLESALKGKAIELWSTAAGGLFLVANEEDARLAIECLGTRRGEIYTAAEARLIVSVNDRAAVAEIHEWKQRYDGVVSDFPGDLPK